MYISYDSVACAAKFRFIRWCPIYATTTSTTSFTLTLSGICIQNKRTKEEAVKDKRSKKIVRAQKTDLSHGSGCIATCHSSPITTLFRGQSDGQGALVVVKCSACFPYSPTIRVRVPLKSTIFIA